MNNGTQVKLDLLQAPGAASPIDHGLASGRIAFACDLVPPIHAEAAAASSGTVITPPLTLPTPGKADVVVTILGDPGEAGSCVGRCCWGSDKSGSVLASQTDLDSRAFPLFFAWF